MKALRTFANRQAAGCELASELIKRHLLDPVVLALPSTTVSQIAT
jgi:predicted phosphoribosyltransferase